MGLKIAVLGWGSLIWDPLSLVLDSPWHVDGPCLPIEFARESKGKRVTLVIIPGYEHRSRTYWAISGFDDLPGAGENLQHREDTSTQWIYMTDGARAWSMRGETLKPDDASSVSTWVAARADVDAAVWTGLPAKTFDPQSAVPLVRQVVDFCRAPASEEERAAREEYVRKAPASIDTPVRRALESEFGWQRIALPSTLFASPEPGEPCPPTLTSNPA